MSLDLKPPKSLKSYEEKNQYFNSDLKLLLSRQYDLRQTHQERRRDSVSIQGLVTEPGLPAAAASLVCAPTTAWPTYPSRLRVHWVRNRLSWDRVLFSFGELYREQTITHQ